MRLPAPARAGAALVLLAAVSGFAECDEQRPGLEGLSSFQVFIVGETGDADDRLAVPRGLSTIRVRAAAVDFDRKHLKWNGTARVHVRPGRTVPTLHPIALVDGVGETDVTVLGVHSDTVVWVIDDVPQEGKEPTYAAGVAGPVFLDQPTIADANQIPPNGDNTESAYPGDFVEMDRVDDEAGRHVRRDLIVTAIFNDGFYVTDRAEPAAAADAVIPGNFGSMFVFNFSYPDDLVVGDRISHLQGTLTDFSGHTQLAFPDWVRDQGGPYLDELAAAELQAHAVTLEDCLYGTTSVTSEILCGYSAGNVAMESLESSIVTLPRARLPQLFARCDFNGDGDVGLFAQQGTDFACFDVDPECECHLACVTGRAFVSTEHPERSFDATGKVCAELGTYYTYGQFIVQLLDESGAPGPRLNVGSRDAVPEFDPLDLSALGAEVRIRGVLRHIRAARPRWLVMARTRSDLCCPDPARCPAGLFPCDPG